MADRKNSIQSHNRDGRISIDDSVVVYIDGSCIRCDGTHEGGPCAIKQNEWQQTMRFQILRSVSNFEQIVRLVRRDRALLALGAKDAR